MGQHYRSNTDGGSIGFIKSMWTSARWCQWVEPNEGAKGDAANVMFFRNRNGLGVPPAKLSKALSEKETAFRRNRMVTVEDDSE